MEEKKKKTIIMLAGIVALFALFFAVMVLPLLKKKDVVKYALGEDESVMMSIPDGVETEISSSKTDAYRSYNPSQSSDVVALWNSLASDSVHRESNIRQGRDENGELIDPVKRLFGDAEEEDHVKEQSAPEAKPVRPAPKVSASAPVKARPSAPKTPKPVVVEDPEPVVAAEVKPSEEERKDTVVSARPKTVRQSSGAYSSLRGESALAGADEAVQEDTLDRLIKCMFIRDEKLKSGTRVTLRLLEPMYVEGVKLPANSLITAICSLDDRLQLVVSGFELNGRIYAARYDAYDSDGGKGIYCPAGNENTKRSAKSQGVSLGGSLAGAAVGAVTGSAYAGQAARAAVSVGQTAAQNTVYLSSVQVKSGYTFFLKRARY